MNHTQYIFYCISLILLSNPFLMPTEQALDTYNVVKDFSDQGNLEVIERAYNSFKKLSLDQQEACVQAFANKINNQNNEQENFPTIKLEYLKEQCNYLKTMTFLAHVNAFFWLVPLIEYFIVSVFISNNDD